MTTVTTMTQWDAIVAAGKAHPAWNNHPRAGAVCVLDGRPIQVTGHAAVKVKEGWRGYTVMCFRYLDDEAPQMGQMVSGAFTLATQREYRRLSRVVLP